MGLVIFVVSTLTILRVLEVLDSLVTRTLSDIINFTDESYLFPSIFASFMPRRITYFN